MNSKKILPIKHLNCTCMNCLNEFNEDELEYIEIKELGYGSVFDCLNTKVILCKECFNESNPKIWNMNKKQRFASEFYEIKDEDFIIDEEYFYEEEMLEYIENLPIQSKELIWNTFSIGQFADYKMEQQDWIDYELNELSVEKCKKYGVISFEEKKAYNNKFPTCEWVVNRVFSDKSIISECPYLVLGNKNQQLINTFSNKCYTCNIYKKRKTKIKDIKDKDFEKYREDILRKKLKEIGDEKIIK